MDTCVSPLSPFSLTGIHCCKWNASAMRTVKIQSHGTFCDFSRTNAFRQLYMYIYIITKSMRALWLVNQLWFIVPVNSWKNLASSELLFKSNRPQVFYGLEAWGTTRGGSRTLDSAWFISLWTVETCGLLLKCLDLHNYKTDEVVAWISTVSPTRGKGRRRLKFRLTR